MVLHVSTQPMYSKTLEALADVTFSNKATNRLARGLSLEHWKF